LALQQPREASQDAQALTEVAARANRVLGAAQRPARKPFGHAQPEATAGALADRPPQRVEPRRRQRFICATRLFLGKRRLLQELVRVEART
jgi:hypothetical protein